MLDGLIDREVLIQEYETVEKACGKYHSLQSENKENPVYPDGSTAGLMLEYLHTARDHIDAMIAYIESQQR